MPSDWRLKDLEQQIDKTIANRAGGGGVRGNPSSFKELTHSWDRAKRDFSAIKTWKEDTGFHAFLDNLETECTESNCLRIVTPSFNPTTVVDQWDQALLNKQRAYVWKIFKAKIKTSQASNFMNTAANKGKADIVFKKIHAFYTEYTLAETYGEQILISIQAIRVGQFQARVDFVNKFQELIDKYNDHTTVPLTDDAIIKHLKTATSDDKPLSLMTSLYPFTVEVLKT